MNNRPHNAARRGFTLTEMLVILGIITIILAIALPAFTAIQGSRSVEGGRNIAAASIGRARAEAIRRGVTCGAFFFVDQDGRTNVAFVALADASTDPDPYDEYKPYAAGADYQGQTDNPINDDIAQGEPAMTSDRVIALGVDNNNTDYSGAYAGYEGRPIVVKYKHTNKGGALTDPGDFNAPFVAGASSNPDSYANDYWQLSGGVTDLVLLTDIPIETLPAGVGLQIVTGVALDGESGDQGARYDNGEFRERYARTGLIAFDRKGRLVAANYFVGWGSPLGQRMELAQIAGENPRGSLDRAQGIYRFLGGSFDNPLTSGFGIVVYRNDNFEAAASDGTATHWQGSFFSSVAAEDPILDFRTTDSDLTYSYPNYNPGDPDMSIANEYAEERWLDANTTPLLVNRFSGTLVDNAGQQP